MPDRRRFRVTGRVQGVGFRAWAIRQGEELGLRGRVRNERDGSVTVEAAGDGAALDRLAVLLGDGPRFASVEEVVEITPGEDPLPPGFDIGW